MAIRSGREGLHLRPYRRCLSVKKLPSSATYTCMGWETQSNSDGISDRVSHPIVIATLSSVNSFFYSTHLCWIRIQVCSIFGMTAAAFCLIMQTAWSEGGLSQPWHSQLWPSRERAPTPMRTHAFYYRQTGTESRRKSLRLGNGLQLRSGPGKGELNSTWGREADKEFSLWDLFLNLYPSLGIWTEWRRWRRREVWCWSGPFCSERQALWAGKVGNFLTPSAPLLFRKADSVPVGSYVSYSLAVRVSCEMLRGGFWSGPHSCVTPLSQSVSAEARRV